MKYYYDFASYRSDAKLKTLQKALEPKAIELSKQLSEKLFKEINYYWTRRNTFGFVFADFEFTRTGYEKLIGKGEIDLYERIRGEFFCVVLSRSLDKNFRVFKFDGHSGIVININYFRQFINIVRNRNNTVRLFLYKFSSPEQENMIRSWLMNYSKFEEVQEEARAENIDSIIEVVRRHKIEKAEDLDKLITLAKISGESIRSQPAYFERTLKQFKAHIDEDTDEATIHDFLFNNIWLIDFQYIKYRKEKKERTSIGEFDISLYKDEIGIERAFIIELKRPGARIVTEKHRKKKPAILSGVGRALSQTINYIEEKKRESGDKRRILKGIVLIGRKKEVKDWFIDEFNQYLHGIEVLTYDEIYERAKTTIEAFKAPEPAASKDLPEETRIDESIFISDSKKSLSAGF